MYGEPDVITKYCYDGAEVIAEYDYNDVSEDYELARKFVYGPGIDEPICMIDVADSNAVYYYHFDGLRSVVALSDANASIVESYSYDVFGEPNRVSDVNNPYFFTARRYDDETGLYYYRFRYYDPYIGRFLQTDPIGYFGGLNLYTYCGNNPLNWVDPWGLRREGDHDLEKTEAILRQVRNPFYYLLHGGPYSHAIPCQLGGYDFKTGYDTFTILENGKAVTLQSSEFGNFLAAYAGYYYGGQIGLGTVSLAGDYFARKEGLPGDDPLSQRDIVRGYLAAKAYRDAHTNYKMFTSDGGLEQAYWTSPYMGP